MYEFFERLFGYRCCGEFTQWKTIQRDFTRPVETTELMYIINKEVLTKEVKFTRRWQERTCTLCGKIQQRSLELYK